jgi:hypothetical protein
MPAIPQSISNVKLDRLRANTDGKRKGRDLLL